MARKYPEYLSPRKSVSQDPNIRAIHPEIEIMEKLGDTTGHPAFEHYLASLEIASMSLHQVLSKEKSVEDAIRDAQRDLEKIARSYGY